MGGPRGTVAERFQRRVHVVVPTDEGCIEWPGARSDGYGVLNDHGKLVYTHRVAFLLGGDVLGEDQLVLHRCDNPPCVTFDHLFSGTHSDNMRDMIAKGRRGPRSDRGSLNANALTTEEVIAEGKRRCRAGESTTAVALDLGIGRKALDSAIHGRAWKHVP